ncbi:uncharacterized protein JN550_003440 [Neoarthrinium moseri]|uniref:uncharacterized protein n=1 Tax=Neoarthrinium moseri TaxID=1658444 RepID=UPI001FDDA3D4|nr:uncharacterized protein JN550_003440 [Neoarthrinium moseri]KAI1873187.1 hypothetical protein JN550_003440 [Neoarthrinium moseri]
MDPADQPNATPEPPVVFRGKKRKTFRQRASEDEGANHAGGAPDSGDQDNAGSSREPEATASDQFSVAEIIRQRNARKARLRGVGFGADDAQGAANGDDELSLMIREEEQKAQQLDQPVGGMTKRFAAQTGLSSELVNKHMMEYIETELAKRKSAASPSQSTSLGPSSESTTNATANEAPRAPRADQHTSLQGNLMEIDLGEEARNRNEAMTERARRRLQGEAVEDEAQAARPKKVRIGRDGKPWRSRNRRTSDAVKRDQLVEEILRENRLDVYETPTPPPASAAGEADDDGAADDRIAEEFRREFMDAMAQRQQKKKPAPAAGAKKDEEVLKGPKLGGSRNARAAMRDLLLKKEKEAKK